MITADGFDIATVRAMQPATRRRSGTVDTTGVFLRVDRTVKDTLDELSTALGIGKGVIVEHLVKGIELDDAGRPIGWPDAQEELPVKT